MSQDLLSNMLSSLKNASMAKNKFIETVHSKECEAVAKVLKERHFLEEVKTFKEKDSSFKRLHLALVYKDGMPVLKNAKRVSKPGRRVYLGHAGLEPIYGNQKTVIVSTSRGVMTSVDAKKKKLGGEVICEVSNV